MKINDTSKQLTGRKEGFTNGSLTSSQTRSKKLADIIP